MKVVLVSLYDYGSLGVRTLHSVVRARGDEGHSVFFKTLRYNSIQPPTEREYRLVVDHVAALQPDLVWISLRSSFFDIARVLTRAIKNRVEVPVAWGGTHVTLDPESAIVHCDYAVVGEGEWPLTDLIQALASHGPDDASPNVWRNRGGSVARNAPRNLTALDPLPFPDWTDADKV